MSRSVPTLMPPQEVLQSYLNDLLRDVSLETDIPELAEPEPKEVAPLVVEVPQAEVILEAPHVEEAPFTPADTAEELTLLKANPLEEVPVESKPKVFVEPLVLPVSFDPNVVVTDSLADQTIPVAQTEAAPGWAEAPFECLLFEVAGLTLAVPLVTLGSIYLLDEEQLTPLFGQPNWFMGILSCPVGNLKVLESARWLMAERYDAQFRQGLRYVLSIQGYDWGLAVHQVNRSVRIDPKNVKWRAQRQQRPWLAGTVVEHMCALVDVRALAELIASGARAIQAARSQIDD